MKTVEIKKLLGEGVALVQRELDILLDSYACDRYANGRPIRRSVDAPLSAMKDIRRMERFLRAARKV